jgi:hypothetical protein
MLDVVTVNKYPLDNLPELFRFEHEIFDRKEIEAQIKQILKNIPDNDLSKILMLLQALYPIR